MPTVTAADEALSSCSQNAAYSATIMAAQIRSAKAQVESGNPAMMIVRETLCTRVTATGAARLTRGAGGASKIGGCGYLPPPSVASLIAVLPAGQLMRPVSIQNKTHSKGVLGVGTCRT